MPRKLTTLEDYINILPDKRETFVFGSPEEAYKFGKALRDNVAKEQHVQFWSECEGIDIDISNNVVRIKLKVLAQEPACV